MINFNPNIQIIFKGYMAKVCNMNLLWSDNYFDSHEI
jgi:hypothetical protein